MKKIIASAVGLMIAGGVAATTASAVENEFGGYWRTRFHYQDNMSSYPGDTTFHVNTRTRLYYTAVFNENLKFVNKFEFDAVWGDDGYGDIGTDGKVFEIKNSYADATFGPANAKIGAQGLVIHRGILHDEDVIGAVISGNFGAVTPVLAWARDQDAKFGNQAYDLDVLHGGVKIKAGDMITLYPAVTALVGSKETTTSTEEYVVAIGEPLDTRDVETTTVGDQQFVWLGLDVDVKFDPISAWGTFIYETGEQLNVDKNAFALAAGVDAGVVHGAGYYITGDDGSDPTENTEFTAISPYAVTAEIMGAGILDNGTGPGMPGAAPTNIMLANVGTAIKAMDNMTIKVDGWYGALAEDNANGNTDIGFELDGVVTVKMLDNLSADIILAYLMAGDATNDAAGNDDDVMEGGVRLSLSF